MAIAAKVHQQMEEGSWIRHMFEAGIALKRELGERRVFDLSLGNPVVEPPQEFRQELERLVGNPTPGMHRYMPNAGYPETREEVAHQLRRETGLPFTSQEVVMTCGAGGGLNVVFKTLLNPGDEVMILAPYFPEYISYIDNHGGVPRTVPTDEGFGPDLAALERAITPRTRAVLVNSPNNPTGVVYGSQVLEALGKLLQRKEQELDSEIFLVSDEPYRRILYDGLSYPHIYRLHHASLAVTSHSKDLALPGERIGYIAINPQYRGKEELVDGLTFCNRTLGFVNAPALMQWVVRALQGVTVDIEDYQRKRDLLYQHLTELGYQMVRPQGAFYMFPRSPLEDDVGFVEAMQRYRVLVVPGSGFGAPGHFRISYCVEDWVIEGALEGFRQAARDLGLR